MHAELHWGHAMSAKEFREYADECREWAKTARTDEERDVFLQMAKAWMDAALIARDHVRTFSAAWTKPPSDQDGSATT